MYTKKILKKIKRKKGLESPNKNIKRKRENSEKRTH